MSAIEDAVFKAWDAPVDQERAASDRFILDSPEKVDWALRKLAKIRRERAAVEQQARAYIAPIEAWRDEQLERLAKDESYFLGLLQEYHFRTLEADPKARTIKRPFGTLRVRAAQPAWERDDEALTRWLLDRGLADLVKFEPRWADVKARFEAHDIGGTVRLVDPTTGEIVDGVVGKPQAPRFSVDLPGDGDTHGNG